MPVATMTGRMAASETAAVPSTSCTVTGAGRRGRRPTSVSFRARLERSRQSARECRARKKLRYQYLEELVASREKAIFALRDELKMFKEWCVAVDGGEVPPKLVTCLAQHRQRQHCTSTSSSVESTAGDIATEVKPTLPAARLQQQLQQTPASVSVCSPTISSSLGSLQQLLSSASSETASNDSSRRVNWALKTEPTNALWYSQKDTEASSDNNLVCTTAAPAASAVIGGAPVASSAGYIKMGFLGDSPDTTFDIGNETLVFDF